MYLQVVFFCYLIVGAASWRLYKEEIMQQGNQAMARAAKRARIARVQAQTVFCRSEEDDLPPEIVKHFGPQIKHNKRIATSQAALYLFDLFSQGALPAHHVAELSKCVLADMRVPDLPSVGILSDIADCASAGKKNVSKRIKRLAPKPIMVEPKSITLPTNDGYHMLHYSVHPHEVIASLYYTNREKFYQCLGSLEELKSFWKQAQDDDPALEGHPLKQDPNYAINTFPMSLFMDGILVTRKQAMNESATMLNFGSMLESAVRAPSLDGQFNIGALPSKHLSRAAWNKFWGWKNYSCKQLLDGYFAHEDYDGSQLTGWRYAMRGKPIAGGLRFAFCGFRGDLKELFRIALFESVALKHILGSAAHSK